MNAPAHITNVFACKHTNTDTHTSLFMYLHSNTHIYLHTLTHTDTHTQIALNKCPPSGGRLPWRLIQVRVMQAGHLLVPPPLVLTDLYVDTQAAGFTCRENIEKFYVDYDIVF